jgi:Cu(I)/Ag(I) efflux system membrane protein CusA/SilA
MVLGKAGRVESPFDPAPLDMIETMVMLRPREFWPRRKLDESQARKEAQAVWQAMEQKGLIKPAASSQAQTDLLNAAFMDAMPRFDAVIREFAYQRNQEFLRGLHAELLQHLVERMVALLERQGKFVKPFAAQDLAVVARSAASHTSEHLAMSLSEDDILEIVRHAAAQLQNLGYLSADRDVLDYRPGGIQRPAAALAHWMGRAQPTLAAELRKSSVAHRNELWRGHIHKLNGEILDRAGRTFTRLAGEEILKRAEVLDERLVEIAQQVDRARRGTAAKPQATDERTPQKVASAATTHHGSGAHGPLPVIDPHPVLDKLYADLAADFSRRVMLWPRDREEMSGAFGGELDTALKMPGWANVWTMPIQNRVDMLNTGINTEFGVRVLGRREDDVAETSEKIAAILRNVPGAAGVVADPLRGKGYLEVRPDREKAAQLGASVGDINAIIETAIGGTIATTTLEGRERHAVRVRYVRDASRDEESIRRLPVPVREIADRSSELAMAASVAALEHDSVRRPRYLPLDDVATVRIVEGPATIKSENGLLRNYVRLNVRDRGALEFLEEARRVVADQVVLPEGTYIEWTGQFEHALETARTLFIVVPIVVASIFLILYLTYRDWADAGLVLLAVPGTVAGGVLFQWLFGFRFSVAVGVGYIACFGMAAATGMIMLVYLREAVEKAGGLGGISLEQLRQAVMDGAVHRLRPKLLTEGTVILGLAPMLWASGVGAEVIRPMAAPVLGGILIADEVIDLLLPVLFYHIRRRRWLALQPERGTVDE